MNMAEQGKREDIPLFKTFSDEKDVEAVAAVLRRGTFWAVGPEIEEFERTIGEFVGAKYALACNSGTSALHLLLLAHGIEGKEVIVPSFTFVATANAVLLAGGTPVFAETEDDTYGLDVEDVKRRITSRTAAIITLTYGGFPSRDSPALRALADERDIVFIEDSAESLGATLDGKKAGSFGHGAIISFCQNKVLATGEGGMLLTGKRDVYEKAKLLRSHGRVELAQDYFSSTEDNDYIEPGYNYRMPSIIAALGLSQFEKLDEVVRRRRERAARLNARLGKLPGIAVPKELDGHFSVYQMYTIRLRDKALRDGLQAYLKAEGIMSKVYFMPVHLKTIYQQRFGCKAGDLPRTEALSDTVLNLPLYPTMTEEEMERVASAIEVFLDREEGKQKKGSKTTDKARQKAADEKAGDEAR